MKNGSKAKGMKRRVRRGDLKKRRTFFRLFLMPGVTMPPTGVTKSPRYFVFCWIFLASSLMIFSLSSMIFFVQEEYL